MFSLFTILALIFIFQNTKAVDICALQGLGNNDAANKICDDSCEKANATWGGGWLGKTDKKCLVDPKVQTPNIYGSVCGCTLNCQCVKDEQITCDESKNKLGPNKCTSNCDCNEGRICSNGLCEDKPPDIACCNNCDAAALGCEGGCNRLPIQDQPGCLWPCDAEWKICRNKCGGCPSVGKKELNNKQAPITKESSNHEDPKAANEAPVVKESPKEKEPSKPKEPANHEASPKPKEIPSHEEHSSKS